MRELKFRVWNEKVKEFNYWGFNVNDTKGFAGVSVSNTLSLDDAHKLSEQFTGITDKNGVEIYEGDKFERGGVVEFIGSGYYVKTFREYETLKSCARYEKVIGNIHE